VVHFKYDLNINQNTTYNSDILCRNPDEKKFLYLFQCEEYDIVEVIVRGVSEMLIGEMN
jgi:type II restriction/modification system DNA methylase subunit YeeA